MNETVKTSQPEGPQATDAMSGQAIVDDVSGDGITVETMRDGELYVDGKPQARNPDGTFASQDGDDKQDEGAEAPDESSADADKAETEGEQDADDEGEKVPAELPAGVVKRLERASTRSRKAEEERDAARQRAEEAEAKLAALEEADKLDPNDFETWDDYQDARRKALETKPAPKAEDKVEMVGDVPAADFRRAFTSIQDEIEDTDPDLWEAVTAQERDFKFSPAMAVALANEPSPVDVMRYLHENEKEAARIHDMSPARADRAIQRIGTKLELGQLTIGKKAEQPRPKVRASNAPEPVSPVNGRTPRQVTADTAETFSDFEKVRASQTKTGPGDWL